MVNEPLEPVLLSVIEPGDTDSEPGDGGGDGDGLGGGWVRPGVGDEGEDDRPPCGCPPPCGEVVADGDGDTVMVRPMCCLPPPALLPELDGEAGRGPGGARAGPAGPGAGRAGPLGAPRPRGGRGPGPQTRGGGEGTPRP